MNRKKWERMERAMHRSEPRAMWVKLSSEKRKGRLVSPGVTVKEVDWGYYYAPYVPISFSSVGIIGDTTA